MGGIKPIPMNPADRWESLVRSGLSEATATAMVRREMARAAIARDTFGFQAPSVPGIEQAAPAMPRQQPSDQVPARPVVPSGGSVGMSTQDTPDAVALEDQRLAARGPLVNAALRLPAATFGGITNPVMGLLAPERNAAVQAAARNIAPTAGTGATVGEVGGALLGTGLLYSAGANALAAAPEATLLPRLARSARSTNWATRAKGNVALGLPLDVSFGLQEGRQTGKPIEAIAKNVAMDVVGSGLIEGLRQPGIAKRLAMPEMPSRPMGPSLSNERGALGASGNQPNHVFARDLVGKPYDDIERIAKQIEASERGAAARVFGEDGAKAYERAQRIVNSAHANPYSDAYEEASALIAKMESNLSPAQESDLFGIGAPREALSSEDMRGVRSLLAYHSPEHLADEASDSILLSMSRIIGGNRAQGIDNSIALANMLRELRSRGLRDDTLIPELGQRLMQRGMSSEEALAAVGSRIKRIGSDLGGLSDLPPKDSRLIGGGTAGTGAVPIMSGVTGGVVGGSVGYASGDTPEQKRERALLGFLAGTAAGVGVGVAAERIGGKVRPPGTEPLPPRGETPAEEYAKLSTFALDPAGEARLRDHLERAGPLTRGDPKTVEPMETVRLVAKSLGVEDVMRGDAARLNRNEVLAIRDIVHTNIDDIERAVNRLADPTISQADREKLAMAIEGMEKQNVALLDRFTVARGEMGRNLNALKILASRTLDPAVWLSKAQSVRGSLGVPDEMRASILRFIREGNREGLVKTIMDARQSTPWEKVTTYWSANLLSNPATHVVNVASNAALAGMEQAKMPAAAFADRLMGLATGQHTTAGWTRSMGNASKVGAKRGFRQALNTLKGGMDPATMAKYDVPRQTNYANPILQAYTTSIFRTLGAEDQVFREMALEASLANQAEVMAKAEGWTGEVARARVAQLRTVPSDEMVLRAVGDAEEAVVRDRTAVGDLLGHISGFAPNGVPVGKFVVPFTRTPGAVATRMAEYSPLGLTVGTAKTAKVILDGLRGMDVPPDVQRDAAKLFARGATGTAVLTLGYLLASKGLATGPGEKGQKTWATTSVTGRTPTSVRVDDQWLEIGRFNPVGNLISLGAHLYETMASPEAPEGAVGKASSLVGATARTVLDQPFLLGIQRALEEINLAGAPGRLVEGIAAGFIPASALLSAVARGTDPVQRQTPGVEGYLKSRLPSASKELPPAIDALGEEKPRQGGVVEQMFSPVRRSEDKSDDPVVKAMVENGIQLTELRKRTDETPEDFAKRAVREGRAAHKNLTRLLGQQRWQRATPEARREMFQEEFLRGRRMGRRTAR